MRKVLLALLFLLTIGALDYQYDVIVVRSDLPADWVIAKAYAQNTGIPIIDTIPDNLDPETKEQLRGYKKFGFDRAVIIGGVNAVSPGIQMELEDMGFATYRFSEADRHGTSARVAKDLYKDSKESILVNGEVYDGLLVADNIASKTGFPILLIKEDEVPVSVWDALKTIGVETVYLINITVSEDIKDALVSRGYDVVLVDDRSDIKLATTVLPTNYLYMLIGVILGILAVLLASGLRKSRDRVSYSILTEDEEKIVRAIKENGGELTQDRLPGITNFSRPKISRIVSDLAIRGVLEKEQYKRTQKLFLKREFHN